MAFASSRRGSFFWPRPKESKMRSVPTVVRHYRNDRHGAYAPLRAIYFALQIMLTCPCCGLVMCESAYPLLEAWALSQRAARHIRASLAALIRSANSAHVPVLRFGYVRVCASVFEGLGTIATSSTVRCFSKLTAYFKNPSGGVLLTM